MPRIFWLVEEPLSRTLLFWVSCFVSLLVDLMAPQAISCLHEKSEYWKLDLRCLSELLHRVSSVPLRGHHPANGTVPHTQCTVISKLWMTWARCSLRGTPVSVGDILTMPLVWVDHQNCQQLTVWYRKSYWTMAVHPAARCHICKNYTVI